MSADELDDQDPQKATELVPDRGFPWFAANPYDVLNERLRAIGEPELSPLSSMKEVNDAYFDLQAKATVHVRAAWDRLRKSGTRLVVDFCLYPVPALDSHLIERVIRDRPMPVNPPHPIELLAADTMPAPAPPTPVELLPIATDALAQAALNAAIRDPFVTGLPHLVDLLEDENG